MSLRALLASSWTLVILILCWLPASLLPVREKGPKTFSLPNFDKLVHLGIFAVFAFLWMRVDQSDHRVRRIFLAGLILAILSELGQELPIIDRDASVMDAVADVLGVVIGLYAEMALGKLLGKKVAQPEI